MSLIAFIVLIAALLWWANTFFVDRVEDPAPKMNGELRKLFAQYDALNKRNGGAE